MIQDDFYSVVRRRRSVRQYTDNPVPDAVIVRALEAALLAPNSSNLQPWEFYWFRPETLSCTNAIVSLCALLSPQIHSA